MFITFAPCRIISLTSLPGPSCSPGKTWIWTRPLVRAATFLAKNSAARCAGSVAESECAKRILMSCAFAALADARAAAATMKAIQRFIVSVPRNRGVAVLRRFDLHESVRTRCRVRRAELAALLRAFVEDAQLTVDDLVVPCDGVRMHVALRRPFGFEMSVGVGPAHQGRALADGRALANMRRDISNRKTDPRMGGAVRLGAVEQEDVMERHLARLKLDVDHAGRVDGDRDFL